MRAFVHFTFHADLPAVLLHDGFDDGQPQAIAFHFVVFSMPHAIEAVENKGQVGGGGVLAIGESSGVGRLSDLRGFRNIGGLSSISSLPSTL